MENILDLVTDNEREENAWSTILSSLNQNAFPYQIRDISLPQCKTGFVYFLISARTRDYTYIGKCQCIVNRLIRIQARLKVSVDGRD